MKFSDSLSKYLGGIVQMKMSSGHQVGEVKDIELQDKRLKISFEWLGRMDSGSQEWIKTTPKPVEINLVGKPTAMGNLETPEWIMKDIFESEIRLFHPSHSENWKKKAKHWPAL